MTNGEIWKDIVGYDGRYKISNLGRVMSTYTIICNQFGYKEIRYKDKILTPIKIKGYLLITLTKNGKRRLESIHRLIAINFISNPNNLPCVNHKNCQKDDNRIENLEWVTHKENSKHAWDNGLCENCRNIGESHPKAYLTEKKVIQIREYKENNPEVSYKEIMETFNLNSLMTARDIIKRHSWNHV